MSLLQNLWGEVDNCNSCKAIGSKLKHVLGGGQEKAPDFALVFINPTHQNISSASSWRGVRFPFIGTRGVWRVLVKGCLLSPHALRLTEGGWTERTALDLREILQTSGIYLTNVVKCTAPHGNLPSREAVNTGARLLLEELAIVKPKVTIAMGLLPFKVLVGRTVKLSEFSKDFSTAPHSFPSQVGPVVPCWFPVGRGNPQKAAELLSAIARQ